MDALKAALRAGFEDYKCVPKGLASAPAPDATPRCPGSNRGVWRRQGSAPLRWRLEVT